MTKEPRNHTEECISCKRRYKKLSESGLCYCCYVNKYGKPPKEWEPVGKYKS